MKSKWKIALALAVVALMLICVLAGCKDIELLEATGHNLIKTEAVEACTTAGNIEYYTCFTCGKHFSDAQGKIEIAENSWVVKATGHTEVVDEAIAPTCTQTGFTQGKHCSVCEEILVAQQVVEATGHTEVVDKAVAPTCTKTGFTQGKHCSVCEEILVAQQEVEALGHTEVVDKAVAPTCTETGFTQGKHCMVCEEILVAQQEVEAFGHTEVVDKAVAPTCTATGLTEGKHCSVCGDVLVESTIIPATGQGHNYVEGECTICGAKEWDISPNKDGSLYAFLSESDNDFYTLFIKGNGNMKNWSSSSLIPWKEYISVIKEVRFVGKITKIGAYAFSQCTNLISISIPDSATSIGDYAFCNCSGLTSVNIPKSVTSIGRVAFDDCIGLSRVDITDIFAWCKISFSDYYSNPLIYAHNLYLNGELVTDLEISEGLTSIGKYAFYRCSGLRSITIGKEVVSIGIWAFSGCSGLTSITVDINNPIYHSDNNCLIETVTKTLILGCRKSVISADGSVTNIESEAFYMCSGLAQIEIPDSLTSIGDYAFSGCSGLTSITIPDSVTSIGYQAFYGCRRLTSITVGENNSVYHSENNCLIKTATKTLILGCNNSVIPTDGSVTSIGDYAFSGCSGLTHIKIPDSVTSIVSWAFYGCSGLTSITIPDSVTSISGYAFERCSGLIRIDFAGTVAEWKAISKGSSWNYNTGNYTVYCTDGEITKSGAVTYY